MMTHDEILKRVTKVLIDTFELEPAAVTPKAHLYKDLDLDSLDAIDLAVTLKSETGIKLKEKEMKSIRTVADIVEVVERNLAKTMSGSPGA